ncbi:LysR family transcriptional regulator, partial [Streptococcus pneumoniae]|nr:LysR family transcriptional regulator [Streptococcus pneumoniae]
MELRVLRYFIAVASEQNISAAAKQLHLSQPTLSRQLKELEAELGTTLFERGNRKITLTEEGLFLFNKAKEIVELTEK